MVPTHTQSLYQQIKEDIKRDVDKGILAANTQLPTEAELMRQYQVSRITVSRALTELREEGVIQRYPGKGSFVAPKPIAQAPENQSPAQKAQSEKTPEPSEPEWSQTRDIACILPTIRDNFAHTLISGFRDVFLETKYICHVIESSNAENENCLIRNCLNSNYAGMLLFSRDQPYYSNELLTMKLNNFPLVLVDKYLPRLDTSYVISDNLEAGRICFNHLYELGHRRLAFFSSAPLHTSTVKQRLAGMEEMIANGRTDTVLQKPALLDASLPLEHYQQAILDLIQKDKTTALVAAQSSTCLYLYKILASLGLRVPEDVSVLSFDNPFIRFEPFEFFTYVDQQEYQIGYEAGRILMEMMENDPSNIQKSTISPKLATRKSTAAANST